MPAQIHQSMFSEMSDMARTLWLFAADESAILTFDVGPGEAMEHAMTRHGIKLFAIVAADRKLSHF